MILAARFLARLPLTDRICYSRERWAAVAYGFYSGFALSLLSIIARRIGASAAALTFMLSMPFVGAIGSFVAGHLAERRKKMPFVFWPNLAASAALLFVALARSPSAYVAVISAWYVLSGLAAPAYASIARTNYGEADRGRVLGRLRLIMTSIAAATSFAAGTILDLHPQAYRILLPFGALFGVANAFLFRRIRVRADRAAPAAGLTLRGTLSRIRGDRTFVVFLAIVFFASTPDKLGIPLEPILLVDEIAIDYRTAGLVLGTITSLASMLGFWLVGRIATRGRALTLLPSVFALLAARWGVLALATRPLHLVPASICMGMVNAGFELIMMFAIMELAPGSELAPYIGLHNALYGVRGLIGPALGTAIVQGGLLGIRPLLGLVAATTFVGAVMLQVFERRRHAARRGG